MLVRTRIRCALALGIALVMGIWCGGASGFDFLKHSVPGKWIEQIVPEDVPEPAYPSYFNDFDKTRLQAFSGQYRRALATLWKLKHGDPVRIALLRAACLHATGRNQQALSALELPAMKDQAAAQVLQARILADEGKTDDAIKILSDQIQTHASPARARRPSYDSIAAHYWLGRISEQAGDLVAARRAYGWFVEDQKFLDKWMGNVPLKVFDNAEDVTFIGRAIDRWASLTGAYENNTALHNVILNIFVKAYDQIDRDYWPAHVAAGEYFLSHDEQKQAARELKTALSANPNDVEALRATARIALASYNFDAVDAVVQTIRDENPTSPAADLLETRNLLLQQRPADARKPLERLLDKQPKNLEAMGLLAASYALDLNDKKTAQVLKKVDAVDPHNATAYEEVAQQLAARRQYPRAEAMYAKAIERAPWWTEPRNGLGLLYTQSGDEAKARTTLHAAHHLDPFNLATTNYLRLLDELAKFSHLQTRHFAIYYDAATDPVIPIYFGDYLESVYQQVCAEYHTEPAVRTRVEVFPTHDAFSVRTTGSPWIGTVGACTGRVIALCAPRNGAGTMGNFNWARVLRHEFTHTVTLAATDNRITHWMTEGLAVSEEHAPLPWNWIPMLYDAVSHDRLFDIDQLSWAFVRPRRPIDRQLAYAESLWICKYIKATYGEQAILKMLADFKLGKSQDQAFGDCLGKTPAQFQDEFFAWAHKEVAGWGYDEQTTRKIDALEKRGQALIDSREFDKALAVWEEIARLRPVDQLPHMRLAALDLIAGRSDDAVRQLQALDADSLNDNRFAKRIARIYRDEGKMKLAEKYGMRAIYIDPYDADAHDLLAEIYEHDGNRPGLARERHAIELLDQLKRRSAQSQ